jgi:MFS transporter, CP family, cyanate transporter
LFRRQPVPSGKVCGQKLSLFRAPAALSHKAIEARDPNAQYPGAIPAAAATQTGLWRKIIRPALTSGNTWPASVARLAILWLAGAALRVTVLAVPPVLPLIHRQFQLSEKAVGVLSGLPVLLFGLAAIPGSLLIARFGARRACLAGLLVVAAASAARGVGPSIAMLFAMTFVMAAGIAALQPALPALVGEWFPHSAGPATAVYANGLLIGEAAPAALTLPLFLEIGGASWRASLALWSLPVAATALLLAFSTPAAPRSAATAAARWWPDWRQRHTWQLGLMQGGTGGLYFASNAFIPDYFHAIGRPALVGPCLAALNLGQLPASVLLLFSAQRLTGGKAAYVAPPLFGILGIAGLCAAEPAIAALAAGTIGFCCAFVLILTLALPPQLAPVGDVHRLSAGMFAVGYSLSCLVPPLGGLLWDITGIPAAAFFANAASAAIVFATALTLRAADLGSRP